MHLVLTDAEQRQLTDAARVLLAPVEEPTVDWRTTVLRHVAALLGADVGGFIMPAPGAPPYTLHNLPDAFALEYFETIHGTEQTADLAQRLGGPVWSTRLLLERSGLAEEAWLGSREYGEFYSRYGIQEGMGFMAPVRSFVGASSEASADPRSAAVILTCFHGTFGAPAFGERGLAKLRLLLPSLEAGIAGRLRFGWMTTALHEALDAVADGVEIRDGDGRVLHTNAALARTLREDAEANMIRSAVDRVTAAVRGIMRTPSKTSARPAPELASMEVRTGVARYRVRGGTIAGDPVGAVSSIVVNVTRVTPPAPTLGDLRERWGLSRQEGRVALLLVRGLTNASIAVELGLSPTTTRHYTESVFMKLGVTSRTEAARRILVE